MNLAFLRERVRFEAWSLPYWAAVGLGALAHLALAELGLLCAAMGGAVSPIWPASGLAVAMVRLFGVRIWPAIFIGSAAAAVLAGGFEAAPMTAAGATLEGVIGGLILNRLVDRYSDNFILARVLGIVLAALWGGLVGTAIGVATLFFTGSLSSLQLGEAWFTWWMGDALGILVLAPALFALRRRYARRLGLRATVVKTGALVLAAGATLGLSGLGGDITAVIFLLFPIVLLAGHWFGLRGATWSVAAVSFAMTWITVSGDGAFTEATLNDSLLDMQTFLAGLALVGLVFADLSPLKLRLPVAILMTGVAIAAVSYAVDSRASIGLDEVRLEQLVRTATDRIRERMDTYANGLRAGAGMYQASEQVTRKEWRDFAQSLALADRYPGILGIGVAVPVDPAHLQEFLTWERFDGAPNLELKSIPDVVNPRTPGEQHSIILYLEQLDGNTDAIGVDLSSEQLRREATIAARDTGRPAITGRIALYQDKERRSGFLFLYPIYQTTQIPATIEQRRALFRGWVLAPFLTDQFFKSAFSDLGEQIHGEIFEGNQASRESFLLATATEGHDPISNWHATTTMSLVDRTFTIRWHVGPEFVPESHRRAVLASITIIIFAMLLAALIANLQSLRQQATRIAESMTQALAASNERFELAIAGSTDGIWDWDLQDKSFWASPRCREMLGYGEAEAHWRPADWRRLLNPEDAATTRHQFDGLRAGRLERLDVMQRYRHKDGTTIHVRNRAMAVRNGDGTAGRIIGAMTDVSRLVQAEERLKAAISVMEDGFGLFDADDRIVLFNEPFMDAGSRKVLGDDPTGRKFEEIVRAFAYHDMPVTDPNFDREAWIAQRMELHRNPPAHPIEVQWGGGRWMRISERRTADGGYVGIWTDVTEIKLAEQRLLTAIDAMADGFALFDAEDRLVIYNKGFIDDSVAKNFPDPRGRTFEEIITAFAYNDITAVEAILGREEWVRKRVERHRNPRDEPFEQQLSDGSWVRVSERRTGDGGYVGIWTDITALKRAETRLRDAIESINEGFALFDPDMRHLVVNSRMKELYPISGMMAEPGLKLEDLLRYGAEHGEYPAISGPEQVDAFVRLWMSVFGSSEGFVGEIELAQDRWLMVSHHPTVSGGFVSIRADITAQKQREAELQEAKEDLEQRSGELMVLARELEEARRAADMANLGKSQFLANMAHELRTPLNSINGFAEILVGEMFGPIQPASYREYAEFIQQSGKHLLSLINDILDLSKIEAGKMELHIEAVQTQEVVHHAVQSVRKMAEDRKIDLRSEIAADCQILHADARAIRQILLNLLSNAIKFTPNAGRVAVDVTRNGKGIALSVADSGIGMTDDELFKALELYGQVQSDLAKKQTGTGLGLPLVNSLAGLHGGSLSLDSEKGKGTTATVFLPWHEGLPMD
jgi:PAS domain S-box-containing protein